jgi:hypothetical protein
MPGGRKKIAHQVIGGCRAAPRTKSHRGRKKIRQRISPERRELGKLIQMLKSLVVSAPLVFRITYSAVILYKTGRS